MTEGLIDALVVIGDPDGLPDAFFDALAALLLDIEKPIGPQKDFEEAAP